METSDTAEPTRPTTFARLLRRYRLERELTQEELAERARLSREAISALERGERQYPRADTVELLADALVLSEEERTALLGAAARPRRPRQNQSAVRMPPRQDNTVMPDAAKVPAPRLPIPPTMLLGREQELARACALLHDGVEEAPVRLLTLTGPGGVGKTRLALEVAHACRDAFADGVILVPLASLNEPALFLETLARATGTPLEGNRPPEEALIAHLRSRQLLLVLDTFEHLMTAAPFLASLLVACPRLAILVTSRTLLQIRGEQALPVPPLPLPPSPLPSAHGTLPTPDELTHFPAVALFLQRAQAVRPDFALTPTNADAVVAICYQLDGLPLALELAAARIRLLSPGALLARLERRLPSLVGGARDLPERHQTLRATLAWSYDLLPAADQALFRRLSVFAGGATLEAVEAVCHDEAAAGVDVLEGLAALVDHSLLYSQGEIAGEPRFSMLDTVREYGRELLTAQPEGAAVERAHASYYLSLAEVAEPSMRGPEQRSWMERLETETNNLRAALRWAQTQGEREMGLRLGAALWPFWWEHGHVSEGRTWLEGFLSDGEEHASDAADPVRYTVVPSAVRARALTGAGILAAEQADYEQATALLMESLTLRRALDDRRGGAEVLNILGTIARDQGDNERAAALLGECLDLRRTLGDVPGVAASLSNLGEVARYRGDLEQAMALHEESLAMFRDLGDTQGVATSLFNHGLVAHEQGEHGRALALIRESLGLFHAMGDTVGVTWSLEGLSVVNVALGDAERAARLLGAAAALREALGTPLPPAARAAHGRAVSELHTALGKEPFEAAWAEGRSLSPERASELALSPA